MKRLVRSGFHISRVPENLESISQIDRDAEQDPHAVGMTHQDIAAIWSAVEAIYRTGTHPGIQLSLRRRGTLVMQRALGHARGNGPEDPPGREKRLMTTDTPVCYFSASKAITAFLVHLLAEQGRINLLDPVSYYLPEFGRQGKQNITIHQILSHRGGIPGIPRDTPLDTLWDEDRIWDLLCQAKPIEVDGAKVAYHAITGGYVMGRLLEKVTGESIQSFLDSHIRRPLGMRWFTYGIDPAQADALALNYATGPRPAFPLSWVIRRALGADIETVTGISNDPRFQEAVIPAANLAGTADEMGRFFQMMLNGGEWQGQRICQPLTVKRAVQQFGSMQIDRTMMIPMRFSAGFMLGSRPFGLWGPQSDQAFGHIGLINKWCWADPTRDISVTLLTTGIPMLAHHLPALARFVWTVSKHCRPVPEFERPLSVA